MVRASTPRSKLAPSKQDSLDQQPDLHTQSGPDTAIATATALAPMKVIYSPSYKTVYCNNIRLMVSQWDLSIGVGLVTENQEVGNVITEEVLVKFSPQFFKAFAGAVSDALKNWEQAFGQIPLGLGQAPNAASLTSLFQSLKESLEKASGSGPPAED